MLVAHTARLPPPRRRTERAEDLGEQGLPLTRRCSRLARVPDEHHDRKGSRPRSHRSRPSYALSWRRLAEESTQTLARQFANNLLKVWPALWTFTIIDEIEPTNNPAERALRGPVIHRKLSLGTQSHAGERFAERALSAATTCRMQHRSLFTYLSELLGGHARGDPFQPSPEPRRLNAYDIVLVSRAFPMGTAGLEPATSRV